MDINQIIKERRSHYPHEFNGNILDDSIVNTLLENANWAPNHTLNYPWRFKILKGNDISQMVDQAISIYVKHTPSEKFNQKKIDKMEGYKSQVSHIIVIVLQNNPEKKSNYSEDISAIACGVQNMYLSLYQFPEAVGYWSTGLGTNHPSMHEYLKLTDTQQLMGFFILGAIDRKRSESNRRHYKEFILE